MATGASTINTSRIPNLRNIEKLRTKLVRLSKPVKMNDNNKDTLGYYAMEFITAVTTFIEHAYGAFF